jgi:hypothetical protein
MSLPSCDPKRTALSHPCCKQATANLQLQRLVNHLMLYLLCHLGTMIQAWMQMRSASIGVLCIGWLGSHCSAIACIGAAVGIIVSLQKADSPATLPSALLTVSKVVLVELVQSRSPTTSFVNSTSAQSQALEWMLSDPYTLTLEQDDRLVQPFALVTLWYSTNGAIWSTDNTTFQKRNVDTH